MAQIIGKDAYLVKKGTVYKSTGLFFLSFLFIAIISFWVYVTVFHFPLKGVLIGSGLVFIVYIILKKPIGKQLRLKRSYVNGQYGEEKVRDILQKLPDTYTVFENVVIPPLKSNIDFVVIGPTGISTIEVKSHRGLITDDGHQLLHNGVPFHEGDILRQALGESIRLSDYFCSKNITFPKIHPLLVFSNRYTVVHFGKTPIQGVLVIGARWLVDIVQNRAPSPMVSADQIDKIQKTLEEVVK